MSLSYIQIGQFQAEMASDSYQLQGMAERGFLPLVLAKRSHYGTPTLGELCAACSGGSVLCATSCMLSPAQLMLPVCVCV